MAVTDWTWSADYRLEAVNGNSMQIPAHSFALPSGAELDLTTLVKVPSSPGYGLPQAEAAALRAEAASAESITGAQVVYDNLVLLRRNGEQINAGRVKGPPGADSVVPGPRGEQGPAGISNANQFCEVSETAGRTVSVWDYLNNREQLIYGDTGERDITALSGNVASGKIYLQRTGNEVTITLSSVKLVALAAGSSTDLFAPGAIPAGFRHRRTTWYPMKSNGVTATGAEWRQLGATSSGWMPIYSGATLADEYRAVIKYTTTDPWPTVLPGVAA